MTCLVVKIFFADSVWRRHRKLFLNNIKKFYKRAIQIYRHGMCSAVFKPHRMGVGELISPQYASRH